MLKALNLWDREKRKQAFSLKAFLSIEMISIYIISVLIPIWFLDIINFIDFYFSRVLNGTWM